MTAVAKEIKKEKVREVVATFFDANALEDLVDAMVKAGIGKEQISMVAGEHTVKEALGAHFREPLEESAGQGAPKTAFIAKEAVGDTVHGLFGAFFFTGSTVAAGALVATAGALGSPILTAIVAAAAVGGIGAVAVSQIDKSEAERLREEIDRGHLLLFVRPDDEEQENQALELIRRHKGFEPHVVGVFENDKA